MIYVPLRRLELSSNEMTRHQEEAWARADSEPEHGKQDTQEAWRQSQDGRPKDMSTGGCMSSVETVFFFVPASRR